MFSWITGPHKLQHKLRNDYIRICPAVVCITTHFQAVIIHLLCATSRPSSVSNLHYAQALPRTETAAARNGNTGVSLNNVTAAERALPLAGPQRASGGPQLENIYSRATGRQKAAVEQKMFLKEDGKQGEQHPALLDGVSLAESTSSDETDWNTQALIKLQTRGLETRAEGDEFEVARRHFTYSFRYCQW